jgi:hypothetical protein
MMARRRGGMARPGNGGARMEDAPPGVPPITACAAPALGRPGAASPHFITSLHHLTACPPSVTELSTQLRFTLPSVPDVAVRLVGAFNCGVVALAVLLRADSMMEVGVA